MKKILLAISLIFLFATCSFAEDINSYLQRYKASHGIPTDEIQPSESNTDTYIITGNGGTRVLNVIDLDKNTYVVVDEYGNSSVIIKSD